MLSLYITHLNHWNAETWLISDISPDITVLGAFHPTYICNVLCPILYKTQALGNCLNEVIYWLAYHAIINNE